MGSGNESVEIWQYSPKISTCKEDAAAYALSTGVIYGNKVGKSVNWPEWCKTHQLQYARLHGFRFNEIVEASRMGLAVCRVPQEAEVSIGATPTTQFLPIDFDNSPVDGVTPDLTWEDMRKLESDRFCVLPSSSDKKYHYHGWWYLKEPVSSKDEILERVHALEDYIYKRIGKKVKLDEALATWCQWFYGASQAEEREYVIDPNDRETLLLKAGEPNNPKKRPRLRITLRPNKKKQEESKQFKGNRIPSDMCMLALLCGTKILYGYRFHAHLPWIRKGRKLSQWQIDVGERYNTVKGYMCQMYNMFRLTNFQLAQHGINLVMTYDDLVETLKYNLSKACKDRDTIEADIDSLFDMLESIHQRNKDLSDEEYLERAKRYADRDCKGNLLTVYRTKTYASETAYDIMTRYRNGDEVVFDSRRELDVILETQSIKIRTFESVCAEHGVSIRCGERVERKKEAKPRNRKSKYQYILDNLMADTYYYSVYDVHEAQFVKDYNRSHSNKIKYIKGTTLVSMRISA